MKIIPLHDNILIQEVEVDNITKGGLFIPDSAKEKSMQGKVIAVGPGKVLSSGVFMETTTQPGETVVFKNYSTTEVKIENQKYLLLKEENILARLD